MTYHTIVRPVYTVESPSYSTTTVNFRVPIVVTVVGVNPKKKLAGSRRDRDTHNSQQLCFITSPPSSIIFFLIFIVLLYYVAYIIILSIILDYIYYYLLLLLLFIFFIYYFITTNFFATACLGQSLKEMCQPTRRDSVLDQIEEILVVWRGMLIVRKNAPSPVIPENGISWRIQTPPNRRADDFGSTGEFANNNGKGIKKEDSILVDDPVTPWREDAYEDFIDSTNKPNISRVLETSVSQKVGQKRNMQRNKKKGTSSTQPKNIGKGRMKVPQQNRNQNAIPNLGNSSTKDGDFKITQPTTTPIGSPPRNIQQPNPTSNVNLSPKITETLQDESPTSSMLRRRDRRSPISARESGEAKVSIKSNSRSPSPTSNRVLKDAGRRMGGIDADHPGIVISTKNNMGTRNRKKSLEKQPSKLESSYVKNNVNSSQGIPILEWYGDNVVDGYDLAIPSDSLAVSKEAFLMQDSSINAAGSSVKSLSPPANSVQKEISSAYRRLPVSRESPKLFSHTRMASVSALEVEHDNVRTYNKEKSTNSDGLEMTPNVVKPPFMHDRGQKGPLYFQTSATYDALIVEKNDDSHSNGLDHPE